MSQELQALATTDIFDALTVAEVRVLAGETPQAVFDGALLKKLIAWVTAHPEQVTALIRWILAMFGVVIPPLPMSEEETV